MDIVARVRTAARALTVLTVVALLATPLAAGAATSEQDRQRELQQEITRLRAELDEVAADEAEVLADVRVTQRRRAEEDAKLAAVDAEYESASAALAAARADAAERRNEVKARTQAVEAARARQALAAAAVASEAQHEQALLEDLQGRRSEYERRIREQQRESDAIAELLRQRGRGGAAVSGRGSLSSPLADPVVTSSYGYRVHPIFGDRRLHTGLDFRAATGAPISAAGPGEVVFAGWRGGYGNCTIIDHGGGVATLYAHQSAMRVAVGDEVTRGQPIGAAGSTGYATGPHLHFEVRRDGVPVDPMAYL